MNHYFDTVINSVTGKPLPGAQISVLRSGSLATIYADENGTPLSNPVSSDPNGLYSFYATPGRYDLEFRYSGSLYQTIKNVTLGGDTVSVLDYGAKGDNSTDDTAAIQKAVDTGKDVFFPKPSAGYKLTGTVTLATNGQRLFGQGRPKIIGNFAGFLFTGNGATNSSLGTASSAIASLAKTASFSSVAGLSAGDATLLHDTVADEYEVNRAEKIAGTTITWTWRVTQPFATPANVQLFKLSTLADVVIEGMDLSNTNAAGGLATFTYTERCKVRDCQLGPSGYIGVTFQSSIGGQVVDCDGLKIGTSGTGSGAGLRVTKACRITGNSFVDQQGDEGITLYRNNSQAVITNNRIAQPLNGISGFSGNGILLDTRNFLNVIADNTIEGSATYAIYLTAGSCNNTVVGNVVGMCNLGGIKVDGGSNGNLISANIVMEVTDATDSFEGGAATAGIRVKADSLANILAETNLVLSSAGSGILDLQTAPTATYPRRYTPAAVPSLLTNGEMAFALTSNTNLRIAVRGSDGTTRVANLALA